MNKTPSKSEKKLKILKPHRRMKLKCRASKKPTRIVNNFNQHKENKKHENYPNKKKDTNSGVITSD